MMENELPDSWTLTTLANVGQIISGGTPSTDVAEFWGNEVNWISPVDLSKYFGKYIYKGGKSISYLGLSKSSAKLIPKGSVLFSSRAPIGYVAIAGNELCTNQGFKSIIPNTSVDSDYLYYFLKSAKRQADDLASGTTFKEISLTNFATINIPVPPLPEQHRIVVKIEELFSELDKGIETLKTAKQQLKVYRQAVLKYAFEGRLTNPDVKDGELPEGWVVKTISELATTIGGIAFKSGDFLTNGKYQVIRIGNIRQGIIRFKESPVFLMEVEQKLLSKGELKINDIVITQTGTKGKRDYGFTAIVKTENLLLNQRLAAIRCESKLIPHYLLYYTWTDNFKNQFFANETGNVGQGNVGIKGITESILPTPPLQTQKEIVQEIESRLSVCDKIEESIEQGLQQAEALRQSILKKAFEGKLVPQDPNDEPANVLLERIKAERANKQPEKKQKLRKQKHKLNYTI